MAGYTGVTTPAISVVGIGLLNREVPPAQPLGDETRVQIAFDSGRRLIKSPAAAL